MPVAPTSGAQPQVRPEKKTLPAAMPEEIQELCRGWGQIKSASTGLLRQALSTAMPTVNDNNQLMLVYDEPEGSKTINSSLLEGEATMADLQNLIQETIGKTVPVVVEVNRTNVRGDQLYTNAVDFFAQNNHIEIEEEDF